MNTTKNRYPLWYLRLVQVLKNEHMIVLGFCILMLWLTVWYLVPNYVQCSGYMYVLITFSVLITGYWVIYVVFRLPDVYRHFKTGDMYEELEQSSVIIFEEDGTQIVVYRPLFRKNYYNIWARRYKIFHELVEKNGKQVCRFKRIL